MDDDTRRKRLHRAFRVVFSSEEGKIVLEHLMSFCMAGEDVFWRTTGDRENCYMQGRQSVALEIKTKSEVIENE